ncbi:MAG: alpha-amylase [Oscillospiraceae bacterium]|nr:alpha-amylase [Oscillospiraceae bacterium]
MAFTTNAALQNRVIYSVYVRAHTAEGTFNAVANDLSRIRALGVDCIWFMPIHPIGIKGKKGSLGCPYANRDYRNVNPAYGTLADFKHLCDAIHEMGMQVMIDVVYNHTSPDSVLWTEHPEFFYRRADGSPGNHVGEWTDVIDLDYGVRALWDYQIETLTQWATLVDGFRCDVASFVPVDFWKRARAAVEAVHPGFIWLAETVHRAFGAYCRSIGMYSARDTEVYEAFDIEYDYDIRDAFERVLRAEAPLSQWTDLLEFQEAVYPANYNKLRFLENHDQPRIASLVHDEGRLINYTAMLYFLKGTTLLYAGQEWCNERLPSLFEREPIDRATGRDLTPLLRTLRGIKRDSLAADDAFFAAAQDDSRIAVMRRSNGEADKFGVFSLDGRSADVTLDAPDGSYVNLIDGSAVVVRDGLLHCTGRPIIFRTAAQRRDGV